eukprot:1488551-Pleurochrysis_carterae.AAC.1
MSGGATPAIHTVTCSLGLAYRPRRRGQRPCLRSPGRNTLGRGGLRRHCTRAARVATRHATGALYQLVGSFPELRRMGSAPWYNLDGRLAHSPAVVPRQVTRASRAHLPACQKTGREQSSLARKQGLFSPRIALYSRELELNKIRTIRT